MTRSRTPLVDVHAHFVTDDYMAAAIAAGHRQPDGMPGWPAWDAGQNLKLMDQWGVGTAVLSVSSPGTHFGDDASGRALSRQVNEFGAALTRRYPGRFGHFASLPLGSGVAVIGAGSTGRGSPALSRPLGRSSTYPNGQGVSTNSARHRELTGTNQE
jgi:predicted TIM-barrel fold metal-dependent hydrolase